MEAIDTVETSDDTLWTLTQFTFDPLSVLDQVNNYGTICWAQLERESFLIHFYIHPSVFHLF